MKRQVWLTTLIGMLAIGCGDDAASTSDTDTDSDGTSTTTDGPTTNDPSTSTTEVDPDSSGTDPSDGSSTTMVDPTDGTSSSSGDPTDDTNNGEPVDFIITIENISNEGPIPTAFSPGGGSVGADGRARDLGTASRAESTASLTGAWRCIVANSGRGQATTAVTVEAIATPATIHAAARRGRSAGGSIDASIRSNTASSGRSSWSLTLR